MNVQSLYEQAGDMTMISSWISNGRAVANHTTFANGLVTCVVGVNGRGSLQVTEQEFNELLAVMVELDRVRRGEKPTTDKDPTA